MTYAEYCAMEREAAVKHEYIAGEVFAMAGGSREHSRLAGGVTYQLASSCSTSTSPRQQRPT